MFTEENTKEEEKENQASNQRLSKTSLDRRIKDTVRVRYSGKNRTAPSPVARSIRRLPQGGRSQTSLTGRDPGAEKILYRKKPAHHSRGPIPDRTKWPLLKKAVEEKGGGFSPDE